jgi:hypothetical protein
MTSTVLAPAGRVSTVAAAAPPDPLRDLARNADVPTLTTYARQHPQQRDKLERAMIAAGRSGDVSRMAQALKKPDYDVAVWMRYGAGGGPAYAFRPASDDTGRLHTSSAWDGLVASGKVTESERRVIGRMADNEGRLDSVQAYDSEIATVGAMQKTINASGSGELPRQVYAFSQSNPAKYRALFADRGWTAEHTGKGDAPSDYTMRLTVDGRTLTARETAAFIKDRASPAHWNTALDPLRDAGRDPDFQAQQAVDFKARLDTALATVPRGPGYTQPISAYLTSEQGAALVLDQSVNRPAHVAGSFGHALDGFFAANPKVARDPAQWTAAQRADYEPKILTAYQAQRAATNMTDPVKRYNDIVGAGTPLSAAPGSFVPTR